MRKMKENIFSEKETVPVKAKYVNVFSDGKKVEVDCMYCENERRVYEIAVENIPTEDLGKELVEEYVLLKNGKTVHNNLVLEF